MARSQKRGKSWRVEHGPSKLHDEVGGAWKSNMNLTWIVGLMALSLSTPTALLPDGVLDCHTSICGGRFAANMTNERVMHYKVRRKTKKLLRQAFKFADLPFDKSVDYFTVVIRCTSEDAVDSKTISKWARALRYVAHCKEPSNQLKTFMKEAGGVNACADLYAKCCGRGAR